MNVIWTTELIVYCVAIGTAFFFKGVAVGIWIHSRQVRRGTVKVHVGVSNASPPSGSLTPEKAG